uniref:Uncharacterized protein n=1 Tax=Romanomermis culicivorax TaxID=13658 RepID=A0A915I9K6_ROMCU
MLPMYSTVVLFLSAILWAKFSRSNVLDNDPRAYCWTFGTIFANISCRLIVAQMTSTRCQAMNALVAVYTLTSSCFVVANLLNTSHAGLELFVVRGFAIVFTVAHVHYAVCVVRQMCEYFDIYCFSIKHKVKTNVQAAESTAPLLVESGNFLEP